MTSAHSPDERFMARAVELALQGRGATAPNPCVGAVLVSNGRIMAEGFHTRFGAPHAEIECLRDARDKGIDPAGCDLYVTLEPCNHEGKTPPCAGAVLEAGVRRVFVGVRDPNPEVAGGGVELLRERGVGVEVGVLEQECRDLIDEFMLWKAASRTYNILKLATTLDGRIAGPAGLPEPVSCEASRFETHRIRSQVQAVIVGGNTLYADNPLLTSRLPGTPKEAVQPYAVAVTSRLPEPGAGLHLLRERPEGTVFWTTAVAAGSARAAALRAIGVRVWGLPGLAGGLDLTAGFTRLRQELGCFLTLCEGGGRLAGSLAEQGLADEIVIFLAPRILADDLAKPAFSGRKVQGVAGALAYRFARVEPSGSDLKLTLKPVRG